MTGVQTCALPICDKDNDKEARQKLAAANAAKITRRLIERWRDDARPEGPPGGGAKASHDPAYRTRGIIGDGEYQTDVRGAETSQKPGDRAPARGEGVLVMDALHRWVETADEPDLFALLGEYGMGKSVTCERLYEELRARKQADGKRREPLLFNLKDITLARGVPTLDEIIEECAMRGWEDVKRGDITLAFVMARMRAGAVVIFDGLDEVLVKLNARDGQTFTNSLLQLAAKYRARHRDGASPRVLIACRTQYFRSLDAQRNHFLMQDRGGVKSENYRALELLPFSEAQVESYLKRTLPGEDTDRLMALIRSVHNLEELSQRPYTLKLIRDFIPDIEAEKKAGRAINGVTLYRKMVEGWLLRDAGKHSIRPEDKQSLAAHLAAHLWRGRLSAIPVNALEDWLHLWLDSSPGLAARYRSLNPEQLEEDLRTATFLSRVDGRNTSKGEFRFAHTSLQEFFLADYLLQALRDDRREIGRAHV